MLGVPIGVNAAFVPTFILPCGSYRFSLGLGFGVFMEDDSMLNDCDSCTERYTLFMFKPELRFHWFIKEFLNLGFGIELPVIVFNDNSDYGVGPWANVYFSIGFKPTN